MVKNKITVSEIAKQFNMHERTLNRHLKEEGTSFRKEFDSIRYKTAKQLLANTSMPLSKISTALGYSDSTAFAHAFKRWSGHSPRSWREMDSRP